MKPWPQLRHFTSSTLPARGLPTVSHQYSRTLKQLNLMEDPSQAAVAQHLDAILRATERPLWLQQLRRGIFPGGRHHGLYLHGSVGTGKTMLLDCFHRAAADSHGEAAVRRCHFHDFMLDVHKRLHIDSISKVSEALAAPQRVICFDEFQVTDVADAVVLHRLFQTLFLRGVCVVATSNRAPTELYKNGLNRQALFEPFLRLMQQRMNVLDINQLGAHTDYRRLARDSSALVQPPVFLGPEGKAELDRYFHRLSGCAVGAAEAKVLPVDMGRYIRVPKFANGVARTSFQELCMANVGATDYMSIAKHCHALLIEDVPRIELTRNVQFNFTRRFITLIDILYDASVKLVIHAETDLDNLFAEREGDAWAGTMDNSDNDCREEELQAPEIFVSGEGGSSGNSTTMLGSDFEWSATGRMEASLAALSSNNDVGFAIQRARSRLMEMQTYGYWQRTTPSGVAEHYEAGALDKPQTRC